MTETSLPFFGAQSVICAGFSMCNHTEPTRMSRLELCGQRARHESPTKKRGSAMMHGEAVLAAWLTKIHPTFPGLFVAYRAQNPRRAVAGSTHHPLSNRHQPIEPETLQETHTPPTQQTSDARDSLSATRILEVIHEQIARATLASLAS